MKHVRVYSYHLLGSCHISTTHEECCSATKGVLVWRRPDHPAQVHKFHFPPEKHLLLPKQSGCNLQPLRPPHLCIQCFGPHPLSNPMRSCGREGSSAGIGRLSFTWLDGCDMAQHEVAPLNLLNLQRPWFDLQVSYFRQTWLVHLFNRSGAAGNRCLAFVTFSCPHRCMPEPSS